MRIWDLPTEMLCDKHLLSEHRELHGVWNILTLNKKGYSLHPETRRWRGKLKALFERHEEEVKEMTRRGFRHASLLDKSQAKGTDKQSDFLNTPEEQRQLLRNKKCRCFRS